MLLVTVISFTEVHLNEKWSSKYFHGRGKGIAFPLQAWTGPEGSRRLRFPDFKTIGT
jgi:hypothetical protein